MKAYLVVAMTITDPERIREYQQRAPELIERFGGRYVIRGGAIHSLEGNPGFGRLVVVEFPSMEAARRFYESPEYAPWLKLRLECTDSQAALVEGYDG